MNRAVPRSWRGGRPMFFSRSPRRLLLMGWPGRPPRNSHGTVPGRPMAAWPRRVAASSRTSPARGSGKVTGAVPKVMVMLVPSSRMWLVVRLAMPAARCA